MARLLSSLCVIGLLLLIATPEHATAAAKKSRKREKPRRKVTQLEGDGVMPAGARGKEQASRL
jgi:hypothetical protein